MGGSAKGEFEPHLIGVDVGGTHTDVCVSSAGTLVRGKALTTHDDYSVGVIGAIEVAAIELGKDVSSLLSETEALVSGTTVVTNALTELRGALVGVLITRGFKDTFRFAGGARRALYDDHLQDNPPDVVPRSFIKEVDERIVNGGSVLVPLDEDGLRQNVRELHAAGAETYAVCFLWSFYNPLHEKRAAEIIHEECPGAFVTLSSDIYPVGRDHERFFSALFNSFCQPSAVRLLDTLAERLKANGFAGHLSFFSGAGGAIPRELAERFPLLLLASGPAGGVTGAITLAKQMGLKDILVGDMGGTSFDTTLVMDLQPILRSKIDIANMPLGLTTVDILSIGAGGGSLAGVDNRGVPKVGPQSAGSMPGPACYGRGGTVATVTDAAVVAGYIDPSNYLHGRVSLDLQAATNAIKSFGLNFGWDVDQSVNAILELTATNMSDALRAVTIERGQDPRECTMFAYGGTLPLFAASICSRLEIDHVVIPRNSSVFCAYGVMAAKFLRRYSRSVQKPLLDSDVIADIARVRNEMENQAREEASTGGIPESDCQLTWSAELKFQYQGFEIGVPLSDKAVSFEDARTLAEAFPARYEEIYGKGTAWEGSTVVLVNVNLTMEAERPVPSIDAVELGKSKPKDAEKMQREILLPGGTRGKAPIYDGSRFQAGTTINGPAIIDEDDTTLVVLPGWSCRRDAFLNYIMEKNND
ncbi:MAG: N-methylhydantoinase A [Gammaproteobacteria bacterium]|jgi:N-methylhydantoinase A